MDGLLELLSSCVDVGNKEMFGYHKAYPFENFDHGILKVCYFSFHLNTYVYCYLLV